MSSARLRLAFTIILTLALSSPLAFPQAAKGAGDKDLVEMEHYTLTMEKATRYSEVFNDLSTLAKANPKLASKMESDADENLASAERRISAQPEIVAVLTKHGFTARDFVLFGFVLFQSAFASETAKANGVDPAKMAAEAHVNPANMAFVSQHKAELEALMKKMQESSPDATKEKKPADSDGDTGAP